MTSAVCVRVFDSPRVPRRKRDVLTSLSDEVVAEGRNPPFCFNTRLPLISLNTVGNLRLNSAALKRSDTKGRRDVFPKSISVSLHLNVTVYSSSQHCLSK